MFALISDHFFYFGKEAPKLARRHLERPIEKRGPGYRNRFSDDFVKRFVAWLERQYQPGVHGDPCAEHREVADPEPESRSARRCSTTRKALSTRECLPTKKRVRC